MTESHGNKVIGAVTRRPVDVESVTVNEVGPRDGLQNEPAPVDTEGKIRLIQAIIDAGIRSIEATSFVSARAVPQMADAAALFAALPAKDRIDYSVLVPNIKGYERAREAGATSIAVVLSASDTMNRKNINMSLAEARSACGEMIRRAAADGVTGRGYIAVAFCCPYEGPTPVPRVLELADEMFAAGAAEVIIADTIGAANPTGVFKLLTALGARHAMNRLSAHFHDTRAMALANVWAALHAGVHKFDSCIGGLGGCPFAPGASGNLATEDLVVMLGECGYDTGVSVDALRRAVRVAEQLVRRPLGGRIAPWLESRDGRTPT